jgi:hypothetical protein
VNLLLLNAHAILEYDEVRMFHGLGHQVFSPGAYMTPSAPAEDLRPALPDAPTHPELIQAVAAAGGQIPAKMRLPDALISWADVIICSALEHTFVAPQWDRIRHKRVIWRTIGQSVAHNEMMMSGLYRDGLQIVRYSPRERLTPHFAGEDALIRFGKDPAEYGPWSGDQTHVLTVTQAMKRRGQDGWTNYFLWDQATRDLPRRLIGSESEEVQPGGVGKVPYDQLRREYAAARVYLHTGTQPASYTLTLIEAMMTGCPVVAIGQNAGNSIFGLDLYEGHELAAYASDEPSQLQDALRSCLADRQQAQSWGQLMRARAVELFDVNLIARQWADFLG